MHATKESEEDRVKASIERYLSQQHLFPTQGIQVRLSAENQAFLNTWRPTRVGIPATMLERMLPGFAPGKRAFLKATYIEKKATVYHLYSGGSNWVPTVPRSVGKPDDIFTMKVEPLTRTDFLNAFPRIGMGTKRPRAWMAEWCEIQLSSGGEEVSFVVDQWPPVEGISKYKVKGRIVEDLVFQTGSFFTTFEITDVFSVSKYLHLHHNGHRGAWMALGIQSVRLRFVSFDGFRLRLRYRVGNQGYFGTVLYLQIPSLLYALGTSADFPTDIEVGGAEKKMCIEGVQPLRQLETLMVRHGGFYEIGRLGAEIAYTVVTQKLGVKDLILNEPGRGGTDLHTKDKRVLVEARFIVEIESTWQKAQISRDLAQMTRKLRRDSRRNLSAEVGYAVISFLNQKRIDSLVIEVSPQR